MLICINQLILVQLSQNVIKSQNVMKNMLWKLKPKCLALQNNGLVYIIPCKDCNSFYIDETERSCNISLVKHKGAYKSAKLQ